MCLINKCRECQSVINRINCNDMYNCYVEIREDMLCKNCMRKQG